MSALSLGDIAKLAGYSRVRIYHFAVGKRIPGKPLVKPPEGQYRFEDTPELRAWCKSKRKSKPKAKPRRPAIRSLSGRIRHAFGDMESLLESGSGETSDVQNAISLIDACRLLAFASLNDKPQPCTKGALAILAHCLLGSAQFSAPRFVGTHQCLWLIREQLEIALRATPQPSPRQPARRQTTAQPALS